MPCTKASNGKWRLGSGKAIYSSKERCEKAYAAYKAKEYSGHHSAKDGRFIDDRMKRFSIR